MNSEQIMNTLVVGASGATGKHLVNQLLASGKNVKAIVRSSSSIPENWRSHQGLTLIFANISEVGTEELAGHIRDCHAVACCLGHNLSLKGMYGKPRKLVRDAVRSLCSAIELSPSEEPFRFVLMNTAGNRNRDLDEPVSFAHKIMLGIIRALVPPHPDNEQAADHLRIVIGKSHPRISWAVVRPDSLINEDQVGSYEIHASPTRSALFNPGKTSRINVGHFMSRLISDDQLWNKWKGQMPVIYNKPGTDT